MSKFRYVGDERRYIPDLRQWVEPSDVVEFDKAYLDTHYVQVGDKNESALWEPVLERKPTKQPAAKEKK